MFRRALPLTGRSILVIFITIGFASVTMDLAKLFWDYNIPSMALENAIYSTKPTTKAYQCPNITGDDSTSSICDFIDRAVWPVTENSLAE
jgi:hypothetical protein